MSLVNEQIDKLLSSLERFQGNLENGNKRAAIGDMDFVRDRAISIVYLLLAEIEEEDR